MAESPYRKHPLRDLFIAFIFCSALLLVACRLTLFVKLVGAPLLFLPTQLGLIQQSRAEDVFRFDIRSTSTLWNVTRAGRYAVYTDNYDMLLLTDTMANSHSSSWLKITSLASGEPLRVDYLNRGLLPYDSLLVPGRPLLSFDVPAPGSYRLLHPSRPATIWITPDYVTGHENLIVLVIVLQLAIVIGPFAFVGYRRFYTRRQTREAIRRRRRAEVDEFWRQEASRRNG